LKDDLIFWLVLKLEIISYQSYNNILKKDFDFDFRGFFLKIIFFCIVKYLSFHNSSFTLRKILFNANGKAFNV